MNLVTIRSQIRAVSKMWDLQYRGCKDADKVAIGKKLRALNKSRATAAQVAKIVGNNSWACPQRCEECDKDFETLVELGGNAYEGNGHGSVRICPGCLKKAVALLPD